VAEAAALVGQRAETGPQLDARRPAGAIADQLAISSNDGAGPPFRQAHHGLQMRDTFALGGGPYHFCERLAERGCVQHLLGEQLLQLRVLVLELLQPLGLGDVPAAVLGLPAVKRRFRDAVLARQIGGLRPGLVLLQHTNDLLFREPCSLHLSVLRRAGL